MIRSEARSRRARRVRHRLKKVSAEGSMRLSVYRSLKHIYAQVIDDSKGHTLVSVSTLSKDLKESKLKTGGDVLAAQCVGKLIAERAKVAGIERVIFDRGSYIYHGRVKALAEAAREGGLHF